MAIADVAVTIGGIAVIIYGLFGRRPFYSDVEMPLNREERADFKPPTRFERVAFIAAGALLAAFGIMRLMR
jgi:hypothetical protein